MILKLINYIRSLFVKNIPHSVDNGFVLCDVCEESKASIYTDEGEMICNSCIDSDKPERPVSDIVYISTHAYERASERFGWTDEVFCKMAEKAFEEGICHSDTKAKLHRYISSLYKKERKANNIRIYGENIYLFKGNFLITVYRVPTNLIKYLKVSVK